MIPQGDGQAQTHLGGDTPPEEGLRESIQVVRGHETQPGPQGLGETTPRKAEITEQRS